MTIYVLNIWVSWRPRLDPWVEKIPWRRKWQPTPVFLSWESHEQRSLAGYSPWSCRVGHNWVTNTFTFMSQMHVCRQIDKEMATHSSILAWRIPMDRGAWWTTLHGVAKSRTRLKWLSMHACIGEGNGNTLQCSCLENPRDRGAWWAAVYGVAQSQTTEATQQQQHTDRYVYLVYF